MCVNYLPPSKYALSQHFGLQTPIEAEWTELAWQDDVAPVIVDRGNGPQVLLASYGMIPQVRVPTGVRMSTLNARAETIAQKKSYAAPWQRAQLCLVPMLGFYEPCYESGKAERWRIGMADDAPFAVAGLMRAWREADARIRYSFTQITINADAHPLMRRLHKPGDEKRSLVIIPPAGYANWLTCRDPGIARSFLQPFPADLMTTQNEGRYGRT